MPKGRPCRRKPRVKKAQGILPKTAKRYRATVNAFFMYLSENEKSDPTTVDELDYELSEFINHLYQDDLPEAKACDVVSGCYRLLPQTRRKLPLSKLYMDNWRKSITRVRATPLTSLMVRGLAGLAYMRNRPDLAAALLIGFVALLRTSEIVGLKFNHICWLHNQSEAVLVLQSSKSGTRLALQNKWWWATLELSRLFV